MNSPRKSWNHHSEENDHPILYCLMGKKAIPAIENVAVTNAQFAAFHGLPVALSSSRRRPFHFANRTLVTSGIATVPQARRASVCGSAAGRFAPAAIRYALLSVLRSTFPARRLQTEAKAQSRKPQKTSPCLPTVSMRTKLHDRWQAHPTKPSSGYLHFRAIVALTQSARPP